MKKQAATALNSRTVLRSKSSRKHQKEGNVTTYFEVESPLLETYVTDDVKPEIDDRIMRFPQPLNKTPIEKAELLWAKKIHGNPVYNKYVLDASLREDQQDYIHQSMRLF